MPIEGVDILSKENRGTDTNFSLPGKWSHCGLSQNKQRLSVRITAIPITGHCPLSSDFENETNCCSWLTAEAVSCADSSTRQYIEMAEIWSYKIYPKFVLLLWSSEDTPCIWLAYLVDLRLTPLLNSTHRVDPWTHLYIF